METWELIDKLWIQKQDGLELDENSTSMEKIYYRIIEEFISPKSDQNEKESINRYKCRLES